MLVAERKEVCGAWPGGSVGAMLTLGAVGSPG